MSTLSPSDVNIFKATAKAKDWATGVFYINLKEKRHHHRGL